MSAVLPLDFCFVAVAACNRDDAICRLTQVFERECVVAVTARDAVAFREGDDVIAVARVDRVCTFACADHVSARAS